MVSPSFVWLQPLWWWQIHLIQLPLNEQRETTSLWSFPFVRCILSDYITWLSKWLCMQIIPYFLVDKGFFLPLRLSCKESSTFSPSPSSSGSGDVTALRCSEPLRSKVGGPSKVYAMFCGMGPPYYSLLIGGGWLQFTIARWLEPPYYSLLIGNAWERLTDWDYHFCSSLQYRSALVVARMRNIVLFYFW